MLGIQVRNDVPRHLGNGFAVPDRTRKVDLDRVDGGNVVDDHAHRSTVAPG